MPLIPALRKPRLEEFLFKANLGCIGRLCLEIQNKELKAHNFDCGLVNLSLHWRLCLSSRDRLFKFPFPMLDILAKATPQWVLRVSHLQGLWYFLRGPLTPFPRGRLFPLIFVDLWASLLSPPPYLILFPFPLTHSHPSSSLMLSLMIISLPFYVGLKSPH